MKEIIKTKRLVLRKPKQSDTQELFDYTSDPAVTKYLLWKTHQHESETESYLLDIIYKWEFSDITRYIIELNSLPVGMVACRFESHKVKIGYVLTAKYWNYGYMSEAVLAVIEELYLLSDIKRIWATCHVDNIASYKLLNKIGMHNEGILYKWHYFPNLEQKYGDVHCFSLIKD